ncbi:MAG: TetR/AcrR family transcriptional regulator, partial [Planctomycetota bacterium]
RSTVVLARPPPLRFLRFDCPMRYPADRKERTRERILEAAGRVFRRDGAVAGLGPVMAEAGLTKGAFSRHFPSKDALLAETLRHSMARNLANRLDERGVEPGQPWLTAFVTGYLSAQHRDAVEQGCPLPPLLSDFARAGEAVRHEFATAYESVGARLAAHLPGGATEANRHAVEGWGAMAIGAVAVSRALPPEAADRVLAGTRDLLLSQIAAHFDSTNTPG